MVVFEWICGMHACNVLRRPAVGSHSHSGASATTQTQNLKMSLSLLRRAILAQSFGASLPLDVLSVRSAIAAASGGVRETRNEQMGSFAAGASLTQRVPASTAASAEIPPSKTYRTGTLAVKVGMTQGACPQGFTRSSSFVLCHPPSPGAALVRCDRKLVVSRPTSSTARV